MQGFKILSILLLLSVLIKFATLTLYVITEHPAVTYINEKYLDYAFLTTMRYGRVPPIYYVELKFKNKVQLGKDLRLHFYFYEFLSNQYRRGFVEMHFNGCSFLDNDPFFGAAIKKALNASCPLPPGAYDLCNMTINSAAIPPNFPFKKGRIYANLTLNGEYFAGGYIDMAIKEFTKKKNLI